MIISQQKSFKEIMSLLAEKKKVFIIGCGLCATLCQSGGEEQVLEMKEKLESKELTDRAEWIVYCTGHDKVLEDYHNL